MWCSGEEPLPEGPQPSLDSERPLTWYSPQHNLPSVVLYLASQIRNCPSRLRSLALTTHVHFLSTSRGHVFSLLLMHLFLPSPAPSCPVCVQSVQTSAMSSYIRVHCPPICLPVSQNDLFQQQPSSFLIKTTSHLS